MLGAHTNGRPIVPIQFTSVVAGARTQKARSAPAMAPANMYFIASNITPDYRQRIDYFMLLSIVNDYEKITGKNSIMSACNLSYRLKRSGP